MRHQPLVSWLTIGGTALALFLIMTTYMIDNRHSISISPETNRDRIFYGEYLHIKTPTGENSASLSYDMSREFYAGLDGIEKESYIESWVPTRRLQVGNEIPLDVNVRGVDEVFFEIYDFNFEEGAPFDHETVEAGVYNILLSRSLAEKLFGKGESYMGRKLKLEEIEYTVTGVYTDTHPLLSQTYAQGFVPTNAIRLNNNSSESLDMMGDYMVVLLASPGVTREQLATLVQQRYQAFNSRPSTKEGGYEAFYHGTPFDAKLMSIPHGSNTSPDPSYGKRDRMIYYIILLILPAINLSSLTRSRLKSRVSEIGVRRAFGCTRLSILWQMIMENFLFSLIGAAIGLLLSFLFILFGSTAFMSFAGEWTTTEEQMAATPSFEMLFSWTVFLVALLFCFVLNLLSTSVPAWKASGIRPAEAISGHGAIR